MASVPTLSRSGVGNVQQTGAGNIPRQSVQTNADMFGAGQGRAFQKAGQGVSDAATALQKIMDEKEREDDERSLMEIEQEIREWKREALQGDNGVYNKKGGNVTGATKGIDDGYKQFSSTLTEDRKLSDKARMRAQGYIAQQGTAIGGEVQRYERTEQVAHDNGLRESRIKGAQEEAAIYYNEPAKLAAAEAQIRSTNARNAQVNGWSPEEAKVQNQEAVSLMHAGVIDNMLAQKDTTAARAYLVKNVNNMTAGQAAKAQRLVAVETIEVESQTIAGTAITLFPHDPSAAAQWVRDNAEGELENKGIGQLNNMFGESNKTLDQQDKAEARIDRDEARVERGKARVRDERAQGASREAIEGAGGELDARQTLEDIGARDGLPAKVIAKAEARVQAHYAAEARARVAHDKELRKDAIVAHGQGEPLTAEQSLAVAQVPGLQTRLDKIRESEAAGLPQISEEPVRQELIMMYHDDKARFAQVDLYGSKYGGKLNKQDLRAMEAKLTGINKDQAKENKRGKQLSRAKSIAMPFLKQAGFHTTGKNDNTAPFIMRLTDQLEELPDDPDMTQLEQDTRYQNVVLGMLLQGEEPGTSMFGLRDSNIRAFETQGGFYQGSFADDNKEAIATLAERSEIDPARAGVIIQALVQRGRPTTVTNMQEINNALIAQGK